MSYLWPIAASYAVTQHYGTNPGGYNPAGGHTGMDFATPVGTVVRAPGAGRVVYARSFATLNGSDNPFLLTLGGGLLLVLDCGDTAPTFIFGHLSSMKVSEGATVKKGDIIALTGNSGPWTTGPHLHFEALAPGYVLGSSTYGRTDPRNFCREYYSGAVASPVAPNQRRAGGSVVNQRSAPNTKPETKIVRKIPAGSMEVFRGYVRGETVTVGKVSSNIWYEDQHGFASALFFDPNTTAGLPDLTPKPASEKPGPTQRVTGPDGAQGRAAADKNAAAVKDRWGADLILTFKGYVRAKTPPYPNTTNIWYVGISGAYFWAGSFTDQGTHGLPDLTPPEQAVKAPGTVPVAPIVAAYDFALDFTEINGIKVEKHPAHLSNIEKGNFPAKPSSIVDHHWGTPPITFDSPLGEWKREKSFKSIHFQVGETRIAQVGSLKDRTYHAGPEGNGFIGIEIDPAGYEKDASGKYTARALKIQANVRALHAAIFKKYGYELKLTLHRDVPGNSTACSPFDLTTLTPVKAPVTPAPAPAPTAPVTPAPAPQPAPVSPPVTKDDEGTLDRFSDWLVDEFLKRKK
jgi:hypothetical protein